jgi:PKD repeat protein
MVINQNQSYGTKMGKSAGAMKAFHTSAFDIVDGVGIIRGFLRSALFAFLFGGSLFSATVCSADMQLLSGHVPKAAKNLPSIARLDSTNRMNLAIGLPLRNQEALTNLLQDIYNPASPNYRHYLTSEQFTKRFGPTEQDYQALIAFVRANGFRVTAAHSNRVVLDVEASVADVGKALHVHMQVYRHPKEARTFFASDVEPSLDLAVPVLHISGLDNFNLPHAKNRAPDAAAASGKVVGKAGSGPSGSYMGSDFRAAYVPGVSLTGTGQSIGLLEFDGYYQRDIGAYESKAGLPSVPLQNVLLDGFRGTPGGNNIEVALDIELAISMAPGLSGVTIYEGNLGDSILGQMASDNSARQISCSWDFPIDSTSELLFQEFAAQGQSFFNASGDSDACTGDIPTPDDDPYITIVGGTTLTTSGAGGAWVSETTWNWGGGIGSSGGISQAYPIPPWQLGVSMSANQGSTTMRNIPDVALTADNVFVIADDGSQITGEGGTSCAAPLWAGLTALINQQAMSNGISAVGFLNPALYTIGRSAGYANCFHDITTGDNTWSSSPNEFHAVSGYDLCTGWGTPNGKNIINALATIDSLIVTPANGFSANGPVGGPFSRMSGTFWLTNGMSGTITWSLSTSSAWLAMSATSGTLTKGGPGTNVTVSLTTAAGSLSVGAYEGTLWFVNQTSGVTQGRLMTLGIGQNMVQNGGFETGDFTWWTRSGDTTHSYVVTGSSYAHSGTYGVQLGPMSTYGYLSQTLGTSSGQRYLVSCWLNSPDGKTPNEFLCTWNGSSLFDLTNSWAIGWTNLQFVATASGSNALLKLGFIDIPSHLGFDDISVVPVPTNPPAITLQPTNQTIAAGGTITLTSFAWGIQPLAYRWQLNKTNIANAINPSLTLSGITTNQAGTYRVVVTNLYGSTTSSNAVLTVQVPVTASFTVGPTNGVAPLIVTFTNTSTGTITNRYWTFGDGKYTNTLGTVTLHTYTNAGTYTVQLVISGPLGAATNIQPNCIVIVNQSATGIPPGAWIQQYFPGTAASNYASLAASDTDGNGMTVWQDYVAGVNPTNTGSSFSVIITNSAGHIVVSFPSVPVTGSNYPPGLARIYDIELNTNLLSGGSWQPLSGYTGIVGDGSIITTTNAPEAVPLEFYRAKARLQ